MKHPYYHAIMVWAEAPDEWVWQLLYDECQNWVGILAPHHETERSHRLVPRAWLDDPDSVVVVAHSREGDWYLDPDFSPKWDHEKFRYEIRPRPRTITLPEREIPEPIREEPEDRAKVFVADINCAAGYSGRSWEGDYIDLRWLSRGLLYRTAEDAAAAARAMCPFWEDGDE